MSVLAVDLGGSHVRCGVVEDGVVLASVTLDLPSRSLRAILPQITAALYARCKAAGRAPQACRGVALGLPALIDARTGEILSTLGKFDDMMGSEIETWIQSEFDLPVRLENDAKLALLGEHLAGAARGFSDVVMVTLGTGIGGAVMLQNRLLWSELGQAGSLGGHLTVRLDGRLCACGAIGCAEAEASTSVLHAITSTSAGFAQSPLAKADPLHFAAVFACKDAGDPVAAHVIDRCIETWSALSVSLIHAYGPQLLLFGGGVMKRSADLLPPIRDYVEKHMWKTSRGVPAIQAAALADDAALVGAEALFTGELQ